MTRAKTAAAETVSAPQTDLALLPPAVAAIHAKILAALEKNDIEALRIPIDWNEVRPLFAKSGSFKAGTDPIEIVKALSFDGRRGRAGPVCVLRICCAAISRAGRVRRDWESRRTACGITSGARI